jgi:galactokinase/mevalonate kinase-like predicted kinase
VDALAGGGPLSLVKQVLQALEVPSGVRVVTQSRVPEGSGLGSASALALAVASALSAAQGRALDPEVLWPRVRDAGARSGLAAAAAGDYPPALRGGVLALHLEGERVEPLAVDPARVEESLLLVDAGAAPPASPRGWDLACRHVDGDAGVRKALHTLAGVAQGLREALVDGRFEDVVDLFAADREARLALWPGATNGEIDRVAEVARAAGGAAKACGAGGGRVVAVWAPPGARGPGRREAVDEALTSAGFRVFPARVDLRGLDVA